MTNSDDKVITLTNLQGMVIQLSNYGATWLSCLLPLPCGNQREVLLGCKNLTDYTKQNAYLGATVGRYANRIANSCFGYDHHQYQLVSNQPPHQLHGGKIGFSHRHWQITNQSTNQVIFTLFSADGEQGYPGNLYVTAIFYLDDKNCIHITYQAETDKTTPINLTNHAYFNLDGQGDVRYHFLQVNSDQYLPVNAQGIPISEPKNVTDDDMDLRQSKQLIDKFLVSSARQITQGYDHAYLLNKTHDIAATLTSSDKRVSLQIKTDKPAIQVYTGNFLAGTPNRQGESYHNYAGIALETQFLPDTPNHPNWTNYQDCMLKPNQQYQYKTTYQFIINSH